MCGIAAVVWAAHAEPAAAERDVVAMRDALTHRGPDAAGLWSGPGALIGHRRLAVIAPDDTGSQPMADPASRLVLAYNGELYNDADLRAALARDGVRFRGRCDTETLLHALGRWGTAAAARLRGMYAFALWDAERRTLLVGRDPLGIKPLYLGPFNAGAAIAIASEPAALFEHPSIAPRPDLVGVGMYATTIRTVLGERTLFAGVRALRPGEWIEIDASGRTLTERPLHVEHHAPAEGETRDAVADSVRRHLRSDVPMCSLLSGGLDSTVIASIARGETGSLRTYCSGALDAGEGLADDFAFARLAAEAIGSVHTQAPVDGPLFAERWAWMVDRLGVPLSTPNEVAINEVARTLRAGGHVVALSGEGADELFGGYEAPMLGCAGFVESSPEATPADDGLHQLRANAWIATDLKPAVFEPQPLHALENDAWLTAWFAEAGERAHAAAAAAHPGAGPTERRMQAHLRLYRDVNLVGLLGRLDTSTMLESVEGRTPLADIAIAGLADRLPMERKFVPDLGTARTKIALREAFAPVIPASIARRPKRSFPLPFQAWMRANAGVLRECDTARSWFTDAAREMVLADPGRAWHLSWPMINLALWARRWWG